MTASSETLYAACWPASRLGEALEMLAQRSGLQPSPVRPPAAPSGITDSDAQREQWLHFTADQLGIEVEPVEITYREIDAFIRQSAPVILRITLPDQAVPVFLPVLRGGGRVSILTPDLKTRHVSVASLAALIRAPFFAATAVRDHTFLERVGVPDERKEAVRAALYDEVFGTSQVQGGWLVRLGPGAPLMSHLRRAGLLRALIVILLAQGVIQGLTLGGWAIMSNQTLQGSFDIGWLAAWGLLLFTAIPLQLGIAVHTTTVSTRIGTLLKQRLIHGTLSLNPEALRHEGMGQFLSRIMDADVFEAATVTNLFLLITAFIQGASSVAIFAVAGSWPLALLLIVWGTLLAIASGVGMAGERRWYSTYRQLTRYLVEVMVGHRTRLAQQPIAQWANEEDHLLDHYLRQSDAMDRASVVQPALSGSWLLAALVVTGLMFLATPLPLPLLALTLGGVLLAQSALQTFQTTLTSTQSAVHAWQQMRPLFESARNTPSASRVFVPDSPTAPAERQPVLAIRNVGFRYREQGRWVLRDCNLTVYSGDRLLLEGPSGGGKSTLAALMAGLRHPVSGLLMLHGYDQRSIGGRDWRRRVVIAPQFHENHIFTETLAFNLLMGRRYPPTPADLAEAETICIELGLGDLLRRLPSGFQQMVGESGWQLSHGERSRVYIARALLQGADAIILDESFGALDAETLRLALECVLRRARTLIVIAHP